MASMLELLRLANLAGRNDPEVMALVRNAVQNPGAIASATRILQSRNRRRGEHIGGMDGFRMPDNLPSEGIRIGAVVRSDEVTDTQRYLRPSVLCEHLLIPGKTGAGKSLLALHICRQLMGLGTKLIIFDFCGEYLGLMREFSVGELLVLDARETPINPFEVPCPDRISPLDWIDLIGSVFRDTQWMGDGSEGVQMDETRREYARRGVFEGSRDFPAFSDMYRAVVDRKYSAKQQRHSGWAETVRHRMEKLLGQLGGGLCVQKSMRPEVLLRHSVIFHMGGLRGTALDFVGFLVLGWVRAYLEAHPEERLGQPTPWVVVFFEEAHRFFSGTRARRLTLGEGLMLESVRVVRGLSMGLVLVDQAPGLLPEQLLANMGSVCALTLGSGRCVEALGDARGLSDEQARELARLPRRRCVVQCPDAPEPCLVELPELREVERPSREEVAARVAQSWERLGVEPARNDVLNLFGLTDDDAGAPEDGREPERMGEMLLVVAQICKKVQRIEERCEELGMSRSKEQRLRNDAEKAGLIQPGDRVGAKWQLYEPTAKGKAWARSLGLPVRTYKSGVGHEFMAEEVRKSLGQFSPRVTFVSAGERLGGSRVQPDLVATVADENGDRSRVVVVQVTASNTVDYEARKAIELADLSEVDSVIVVTRNKGSRRRLDEEIVKLASRDRGRGRRISEKVRVLDFETAVEAGLDSGEVIGVQGSADTEERER